MKATLKINHFAADMIYHFKANFLDSTSLIRISFAVQTTASILRDQRCSTDNFNVLLCIVGVCSSYREFREDQLLTYYSGIIYGVADFLR